jgi:hypothetical protein
VETANPEKKGFSLFDGWSSGPGPMTGPECAFGKPDGDSGHFVAGASFYVLRPYPSSTLAYNTAITTTFPGLNTTTTTSTSPQNFSQHYNFAPLVWLGYVTPSGLGVRARYWYYENTATLATTNGDISGNTVVTSAGAPPFQIHSPGPGVTAGIGQDQMQFTDTLRLNVWDIEATQLIQSGSWALLVGGGARYATLNQSYGATRFNPGGTLGTTTILNDAENANFVNNFKGAGPMAMIEAYRALGNTGVALYGAARGAVLFGTHREPTDFNSITVVSAGGGAPIGTIVNTKATPVDYGVVPVAELELGGLWFRDIGGFRVFIRTAGVGQVWYNVGTAINRTGDLGFLGGNVALGVTY